MSYSYLPEYTTTATVDTETAKHDRIELNIGEWMFTADDDLNDIANRLSRAVTYIRDYDGRRFRFQLLNRPRGQSQYLRKIPFKALGNPHFPTGRPLFQGRLILRRDTTNHRQHYVKAELIINPTRAMAQYPRGVFARSIFEEEEISSPVARTEELYHSQNEFPLRPSDNYLHDGRLARLASGPRWRQHIQDYIMGIETVVGSIINQMCSGLGTDCYRNEEYNLKLVETYWEFRHFDPIRLVHQLTPHFRSLGKAGRLVDYSVTNTDELFPTELFEMNSPLLRITKNASTDIKIYAKTNQRVRFEVEQKSGRSTHTFETIPDMMELLEEFTQEATQDMEQVLSNLNEASGAAIEQRAAYDLLFAIMSATDIPDHQRLLASSLVMQGGYTKIPNHPVNNAVDLLRGDGVVRPSFPRSQTYQLTPEYQQARATLAGQWSTVFEDT